MAITKVTANVLADNAVSASSIANGAIATAKIADDAVSYAKLGAEFTTAAALSGTAVDWATAAVFTKTLSANTTLTFSNVSTGMVLSLIHI